MQISSLHLREWIVYIHKTIEKRVVAKTLCSNDAVLEIHIVVLSEIALKWKTNQVMIKPAFGIQIINQHNLQKIEISNK